MPWLSLPGRAKISAGGEEETARRDRSGSGDRNVGGQGLRSGRESGAFFTAVSEGPVGRDKWRQSYDGGRKIGQKARWINQGPFIE